MTPPFSRTFQDLLRENALLSPDAVAVIDGDQCVTFSELHARAQKVAFGLAAANVSRGDRVGALLSNRVEWLEVCFGAFMAGATVVPISTWSTSQELAFLLEDAELAVLFALGSFGERDFLPDLHAAAACGIHVVVVDSPPGKFDAYQDFGSPAADLQPPDASSSASDDAFILYTSGSTNHPKGVRLKHFAIIENGFNIGERQGLGPRDRVFLSAPLFWAYGSANALPAAFTHGSALVLADRFEAGRALDAIEANQCTAIYTLPAMTAALLRHEHFNKRRTASLRTGLTIGSREEFLLAAQALGVDELCNVYGATETYGNCAVTWHHWPLDRRASTQGTMLPGQEIQVRNPETGKIINPHEPGLIEIRGHVTPGYWGKSAALNADAFTADGFYKTGDIGKLDNDGAFVFVGRATDMIKRAGINVSPAEIESSLVKFPGIEAAAVVGVPHATRGEAIMAFIVPNAGSTFPVTEVFEFLRHQLSKYKIPDWIEMVGALPLTSTGKVHKKQIKDDALALAALHLGQKS